VYLLSHVLCCTNFLITKGASVEGANMISYNADSHILYGELYHYPAGDHPNGSMVNIYDWDSGVYLGKIPQVSHTYNVIGNINEYSLSIGETTFGGLADLQSQPGAIVDYGSLIYLALQRSKTAREAISVMGSLVAQYGYYSEGESFSLADTNEVWVFEMIGKGKGEVGAVWVALRIPDGYICSHANQARIRTFPLNDPDNCMYSSDVISFAKRKGYYPNDAPDYLFSFSDIYDPVTPDGARFCEARVWSFFNHVNSGMDRYLDYAQGKNVTNRMPLWIRPDNKISLNDTFTYMRDFYANTWFEFRYDVGAEAAQRPIRWRPLTWTVGNQEYVNERAISTQQTGFSFVAQLRPNYPAPIGGILWFGVDDSALALHVPMYCGMTKVPHSYSEGNGDMMTFSFNSAFWVFNLLNNYVYTRYNLVYPEVLQKIVSYENNFLQTISSIDTAALKLWNDGKKSQALGYITDYSVKQGDKVVSDWLVFWQSLFVKYMDGNRKFKNPNGGMPIVEFPGYGDTWYQRVAKETGDRYKPFGPNSNKLANKKIF